MKTLLAQMGTVNPFALQCMVGVCKTIVAKGYRREHVAVVFESWLKAMVRGHHAAAHGAHGRILTMLNHKWVQKEVKAAVPRTAAVDAVEQLERLLQLQHAVKQALARRERAEDKAYFQAKLDELVQKEANLRAGMKS